MRRTIFILTTLSIVLLRNGVYAQNNNTDKPYQLVYEDSIPYAKEIAINFIDTITGKILNTINLIENNPFNKLNYPESDKKSPDEKNKVYHITKIPIESISLLEGNLVLRQNMENPEQYTELTGSSFYQVTVSGDYLVISYSFYLTSFGMVIGRSDAVFIFDQLGNLIHKLTDFDTNVREWALTENGRYFSYAFGSVLDEWSGPFTDAGYKVIDLTDERVVCEQNLDNQCSEVRTRSFENFIKVSCHSIESLYIIIDFAKKKKYSRYFTRNEKNLWKRFTNEGLEIYDVDRQSNTIRLLRYEDEFKVEEIK
ncbi:MAG: hypothetical protein R2764_24370 [Bacteroidales bacterium]